MTDLLVYPIDVLSSYKAIRDKEVLEDWLTKNGVGYTEVFRFEYHRHLNKLWVESFIRNEEGRFYELPGEETAAWRLWETPVLVPPSSSLLADMAQAVELFHGNQRTISTPG